MTNPFFPGSPRSRSRNLVSASKILVGSGDAENLSANHRIGFRNRYRISFCIGKFKNGLQNSAQSHWKSKPLNLTVHICNSFGRSINYTRDEDKHKKIGTKATNESN